MCTQLCPCDRRTLRIGIASLPKLMDAVIERIRATGADLHAGLNDVQLAEFQAALGAALPPDLEQLYRDHDGIRGCSELAMRMLSSAEVVRETAATRACHPGLLEPGASLFWTDDNGNYAGVFLSGVLAHRAFVLDHEEPDPTPRFFDVRSLCRHLVQGAGDIIGEDIRDYPAIEDLGPTAAEDRELGRQFLRAHTARPDDPRSAFLALALLPPADTHLVVPLLRSPDMWIQEQACVLLGRRRYEPAIPELVEVARVGKHNGKAAALRALQRIDTSAADVALQTLDRE